MLMSSITLRVNEPLKLIKQQLIIFKFVKKDNRIIATVLFNNLNTGLNVITNTNIYAWAQLCLEDCSHATKFSPIFYSEMLFCSAHHWGGGGGGGWQPSQDVSPFPRLWSHGLFGGSPLSGPMFLPWRGTPVLAGGGGVTPRQGPPWPARTGVPPPPHQPGQGYPIPQLGLGYPLPPVKTGIPP